ncbi:FMN-binding glutamate synthase family protein [Ammoniphilus sp. CFH 90114]|uniref:FMN-binding glutamate synthase family protein n=1 Tax=Ammoniphilus sp. CFH 90114 TaxID=2493665 RepID=UPI00100DD26B|nr:FMN-binding glutamate synthase family protein [Ammoniphilus sp. CFH 90114]RXT04874.1 FMN-binding glutamate synthase family protein [Ammoniphilus sp. CFH 90114]
MKPNWLSFIIGSFSGALLAILFTAIVSVLFMRPLTQLILGAFIKRIMKDRYPENIWEMVTAITRTPPTSVVENSLRAESGKVIERPFGSPRKFLHFDGLIFSPAQLAILPAPDDAPVDTKITIGPQAKRPLTLDIPIMLGAWGYGIGVSEKLKIAAAKATSAVGTASNTGEGPLLPEDREISKYLIMQYSSGPWTADPEKLRQADAIEIHIGQGASAAAASRIPPEFLQGRAREMVNVKPGEDLVIPSRHKEINKPTDLKRLVKKLRTITDGVPIGVKICASANLEADLEVCIHAGVDFISIDGGQAGTKGGPPILEDDFGLPTIYALSRAVQYLRRRGVKQKISLLIGGGFSNPGQCMKALALGADGVYLGTAPLWAMTHEQVTKAIPWEPPTQLAFYPGTLADELDEDLAATHLENFFNSYIEEIKVAIRAMGKTSLLELSETDLVALDEITSKVTKVRLAYDPYQVPSMEEVKARKTWMSKWFTN